MNQLWQKILSLCCVIKADCSLIWNDQNKIWSRRKKKYTYIHSPFINRKSHNQTIIQLFIYIYICIYYVKKNIYSQLSNAPLITLRVSISHLYNWLGDRDTYGLIDIYTKTHQVAHLDHHMISICVNHDEIIGDHDASVGPHYQNRTLILHMGCINTTHIYTHI